MEKHGKKHTKQHKDSREEIIDKRDNSVTILQPRQSVVHEDDIAGALDDQNYPFMSVMAADIPENNVEIVAASEATLLQVGQKLDDKNAVIKIDSNFAVVSNSTHTIEKEEQLSVKDSKMVTIKPSISSFESMEVTEIQADDNAEDSGIVKLNLDGTKANESLVPKESIITSETLINMMPFDFKSDEITLAKGKPSMLLKDAVNVTEQITSFKESPLEDVKEAEKHAQVSISPLVGINISEVSHEQREQEFQDKPDFTGLKPRMNFNLHESIEVGEVFVEDKSGKYYPELIVPTEIAKKEFLVSNQILTKIHDVQEKEGLLQSLKLPPSQEANIDVTPKNSLMITVEDGNEKEGDLSTSETTLATATTDLLLHSGLTNTVTSSQIKETNLVPDSYTTNQAHVGINEYQHKFNIETEIHDSETTLAQNKPKTSRVEISISTLDTNVTDEIVTNEREKELILPSSRNAAKAQFDIKIAEPLITSETLQINSVTDFESPQQTSEESATESFPTENSKIITEMVIHEQEITTNQCISKREKVTQSLVPNTSVEVTHTELSERENILSLNKIPEASSAKKLPTHQFQIPIAEEITTADQIEFLSDKTNVTSNASVQRDLHEEITVLEATIQEQLEQIEDKELTANIITPTFISKQSLNVTEIVSSVTEENLETQPLRSGVFAKLDMDVDHKIAVTSEIRPRDTLDQLVIKTPQYEEASSTSKTLTSVEITENEALDSQTILKPDLAPDSKILVPEVVTTAEMIKISEVVQHEKEGAYHSPQAPEQFKASTEVSGQIVAVSSELVSHLGTGYTEEENIKGKFKKANVDNVAHRELTVLSVNTNEKETLLNVAQNPNTVTASLNIDTCQGIIVQENQSALEPTSFNKPKEVIIANANQSSVTKEAITQEETLIHTSEGILSITESESKVPSVLLSTLQAPQYDEKILNECEAMLDASSAPSKHSADISITKHHGIEITEIISQTDNIKENDAPSDITHKTAIPKRDDHHFGKIASSEEVMTVQSTDDMPNEEFIKKKTHVSAVELHTLQQIEIVVAEGENVLPNREKRVPVAIAPDITETLAIITTTVEPEDNESTFSSTPYIPLKDASILFEPHTSTINIETISSSNVEAFSECVPKSSTADAVHDETYAHILGITTLHGEKEEILPQDNKNICQEAVPKFVEKSAKEIIEVRTMDSEKDFYDHTIKIAFAQPNIDEQRSILNTEVMLSHEIEDIEIPDTKSYNVTRTQGVQEALENIEPFVGESEGNVFETMPVGKISQSNVGEQTSVGIMEIILSESESPLKEKELATTEKLKEIVETHKYVDVTEILSNEFENDLETKNKPLIKTVEALQTLNIQSHVGVNETVTSEEVSLAKSFDVRSKNAGINVHPCDHINRSEPIVIEKEDNLNIEKIPRSVSSQVSLLPYKHLNIEECQATESTSKELVKKSSPLDEIRMTLEPQQHVTVTDVSVEENESSLSTPALPKTEAKSVSLETTQHITVNVTVPTEKELEFIGKPVIQNEKAQQTQSYLQEVSLVQTSIFDSVSQINEKYKPQQEIAKSDIEISKCYQTSEQILHEDSRTFESIFPDSTNAENSVESLKSIVLTEVISEENPEIFSNIVPQNRQALTSHTVTEELISTHPQVMDTNRELESNYKPETAMGLIQIESLKSYTTTENILQQVPENIETDDQKLLNAQEKHLVIDELMIFKPQVLENVSKLTITTTPETNKADVDMRLCQSYTVAEPSTHEATKDFVIEETLSKQVNEQLLDLKPLEQSQVVAEEYTTELKSVNYEKNNITQKTTELQPVSQADIFIHDSEVPSNFEKTISTEKASISLNTSEGITIYQITQEDSEDSFNVKRGNQAHAKPTVTPCIPLQCSENIPQSHVAGFTSETVQNTTTKVISSQISPLIVTDIIDYQHEDEIKLTEPKKQHVSKGVTLANEIATTEEFVDEQTQQLHEKTPLLALSKVSVVELQKVTVSQPDIIGKLLMFADILTYHILVL